MTARSSSPNRTNTLTKGSIRTQVNLVYGNCNRMSLLAGNVKVFIPQSQCFSIKSPWAMPADFKSLKHRL